MAGTVRLTYEEMESNCSNLQRVAENFQSTTGEMMSIVNSFNGAWEGAAAQAFEEDYVTLQNSLNATTEVLQEITTMVQNYVNQMREIEAGFATSHVTMR